MKKYIPRNNYMVWKMHQMVQTMWINSQQQSGGKLKSWNGTKTKGLQEQEDYFRTPLGYCDEVKTNLQQVCGR